MIDSALLNEDRLLRAWTIELAQGDATRAEKIVRFVRDGTEQQPGAVATTQPMLSGSA